MGQEELILAAAAAYFSGKGYYVNTNFTVPGTQIALDLVAVLPKMRELKPRLKMGFAPTGILVHLLDGDWIPFERIVDKTGFDTNFVGEALTEAAQNDWVEIDIHKEAARCRIKNYKIPARECVLAFLGTQNFTEKLDTARALEGCYHKAFFIFPYSLDDRTTDQIALMGGGIIKYHQTHGVFQELMPAQTFDIESIKRYALIVEKVLYDNVWVMTEEII